MKKSAIFREYFESIIIAVILALFVRTFVFEAMKIPTGSMEDNLLVGDHLIVNKFIYAPVYWDFEKKFLPIKEIERGDVIVFKYPEDPRRDFVKRVIGVGNDLVEIRERQVYINNQSIEEPYKVHKFPSFRSSGDNYGPQRIPPDHYFGLGDNRDNSRDSRYWGFIPQKLIKGKPLLIYWSYEAQPGAYLETSFKEKLKNIFSTIGHFFTRTRWRRTLKIVR
ncbi:MAG: signal peptidase I [Candidatus Aminicenantes bacterium]|nr:signal peptidase I [Candidatus Aminicenantes bacterium]MDH5714759.1 signal peptidase I [Candidatus Aminicenantes bacterium]